VLYLGKVYPIREKSNKKSENLAGETDLFWSSFVELDEPIPNMCRTKSENVRFGSYEKGANENSLFFKFDILTVSRKPKISKKSSIFLISRELM
jgi:hypothetical protein